MPKNRPISLLLLLLMTACAPLPAIRPPFPLPPPAARGTVNLDYASSFRGRDTDLAGWNFVLDPGHGGRVERGALSSADSRVTEADINFTVAQWLAGMLRASGAIVTLTRDADIALLDTGSLGKELAARAEFGNQRAPDFFLSLHHNSNARRDYNKIEIYHKLFTQGPSAQLGELIARELSRLYPGFDTEVVAGNFAVVRGSAGEALLLEFSYLSDTELAPLIGSLPLMKKEAEAVFEAVRIFARNGRPEIRVAKDSAGIYFEARDRLFLRSVAWRAVLSDSRIVEGRAYPMDVLFSRALMETGVQSLQISAVNEKGREALEEWWSPVARTESRPIVLFVGGREEAFPADDARRAWATRRMERAANNTATLRLIERTGADFVIVIEEKGPPGIIHYWRSPTGTKLASAVGMELKLPASGGSHYLLSHTSAPAIVIATGGGTSSVDALSRGVTKFIEERANRP